MAILTRTMGPDRLSADHSLRTHPATMIGRNPVCLRLGEDEAVGVAEAVDVEEVSPESLSCFNDPGLRPKRNGWAVGTAGRRSSSCSGPNPVNSVEASVALLSVQKTSARGMGSL